MNLSLPEYSGIQKQVKNALTEDIGSGDVTARLIDKNQTVAAEILCRTDSILCGCKWVDEVFQQVDKAISVHWNYTDSSPVTAGSILCTITGNARHILTAERTALNFLQTLSATASATHQYVKAIKNTQCKILDTRKTIPGMRLAQKYAVRAGGGVNHRSGLYDMVLIKENHISASGSIRAAVEISRKINPTIAIEVEVENLAELEQALACNVDRIMLDNMSPDIMQQAVEITRRSIPLEASGGVNLGTVREIAETGVDYISVGEITKDIHSIDLSLRITDTLHGT